MRTHSTNYNLAKLGNGIVMINRFNVADALPATQHSQWEHHLSYGNSYECTTYMAERCSKCYSLVAVSKIKTSEAHTYSVSLMFWSLSTISIMKGMGQVTAPK